MRPAVELCAGHYGDKLTHIRVSVRPQSGHRIVPACGRQRVTWRPSNPALTPPTYAGNKAAPFHLLTTPPRNRVAGNYSAEVAAKCIWKIYTGFCAASMSRRKGLSIPLKSPSSCLTKAAVSSPQIAGSMRRSGRTMLVSARRLVHPDNNSTSILILFGDVTDQRQVEAQKDILLAETRHRMKNLLGIVRSIANQTVVKGQSAEEYRDAFLGRFQAVAEAENLALASSDPADLSTLIEQVLMSAGPERYRVVRGPQVSLGRQQVIPVSLILHELVTNAWKYGAFSQPGGLVHVTWRLAQGAGETMLHLEWQEENGPPVTPPTRAGFGSRLIELSAVQGLGGTVELKYEPRV